MANQPVLFSEMRIFSGSDLSKSEAETLVLFALGDFKSRGKKLTDRTLPLDRLRGALRRSAQHHKTKEMTDGRVIAILRQLGAQITRLPAYVAKHPYHVSVSHALADRASAFYKHEITKH